MTPQQLKAYINAHIKTNGKGEISGEVLNTALNAMLEILTPIITICVSEAEYSNYTKQQLAEALEITEDDLDVVMSGNCILSDLNGVIHYLVENEIPTGGTDVIYSSGYVSYKSSQESRLRASSYRFSYDSDTNLYNFNLDYGRVIMERD